jgi:hypothetical protein
MRRAWVKKVVEAAGADLGVAALRHAWRATHASGYYGLAWARDGHGWPRALGLRGRGSRVGPSSA